jgi:hypothetical protein
MPSIRYLCFLCIVDRGLCILPTADYDRKQKEYIHLYCHDLVFVLVLLFRGCGANRVYAACRTLSFISVIFAVHATYLDLSICQWLM